MTNLDQFESVFKSADREPFTEQPIHLDKVLVVTDGDGQQAEELNDQLRQFFGGLQDSSSPRYFSVTGDQFSNVRELLERIEEVNPAMICTPRNLHDPIPDVPHSLGAYVDVMTQVISCPVLLVPRGNEWSLANEVMAITDHLSGDNRLVSYAAALTAPGGTLVLVHVEDEQVFRRYISTIGKIPSIDTTAAEEDIREQLLKEPADYILSCQQALEQRPDHSIRGQQHTKGSQALERAEIGVLDGKQGGKPPARTLQVESVIMLGHLLEDYKRLIARHEIDLLVLNTKDDDQLAMHGLAYPLAIEMRNVPLLLL